MSWSYKGKPIDIRAMVDSMMEPYKRRFDMPLPEGLDHNVNRNSFTKEDAVKIFTEAAEQVQSSATAAKLVSQLLDVGFVLLKAIGKGST